MKIPVLSVQTYFRLLLYLKEYWEFEVKNKESFSQTEKLMEGKTV